VLLLATLTPRWFLQALDSCVTAGRSSASIFVAIFGF
jgi:hypothetical protein